MFYPTLETNRQKFTHTLNSRHSFVKPPVLPMYSHNEQAGGSYQQSPYYFPLPSTRCLNQNFPRRTSSHLSSHFAHMPSSILSNSQNNGTMHQYTQVPTVPPPPPPSLLYNYYGCDINLSRSDCGSKGKAGHVTESKTANSSDSTTNQFSTFKSSSKHFLANKSTGNESIAHNLNFSNYLTNTRRLGKWAFLGSNKCGYFFNWGLGAK